VSRCIFDGLTPDQARVLAEWFEGAGEQDCGIWFAARGVPSPLTDVSRPGGFMEVRGDDVIVHCKTVWGGASDEIQ
jgi:hypothetical protein